MNPRRLNRSLATSQAWSNQLWWLQNEKGALRNARESNLDLYRTLGTELTTLRGARDSLENVLAENSRLSIEIVSTHRNLGRTRFWGSRRNEFIEKLTGLSGRITALRNHTRNNGIEPISTRIGNIETRRTSINNLREAQLGDIRFLEDRIDEVRRRMG